MSVRCAIYTRKSTEGGLDQAFNSLDAQRAACEAYVASQAGEGWVALPTLYDDGGFSGGNLDRPALGQLLADVAAGLVDTIVVYKIDRLTRSLGDFSKIVERLDAAKASFVSVTQAFNTTTSMGRLTLNVLLSFAQFEREVTGERIRDKIAASKARGMWMGGVPPLGYDVPASAQSRTLVVNEPEAEVVRSIFGAYLRLASVTALAAELETGAVRSKSWTTRAGKPCGGQALSRGALFHLLKNRVYLGEIIHKGQSYPGAHTPILSPETFSAAQALLARNAKGHRTRPLRSASAPLKGLLFDVDGHPMSPSFTHGDRGQVYRYYVSAPLQQGRMLAGDVIRRAPAPQLDGLVLATLKRLVPSLAASWTAARPVVRQVQIFSQLIDIQIDAGAAGAGGAAGLLEAIAPQLAEGEIADVHSGYVRVRLPVRAVFRGGRTWLKTPSGKDAFSRPKSDQSLIKALRTAHKIVKANNLDLKPRSVDRAPADAYERRICPLAFLAPDIQLAILQGRQPASMKLEMLTRQSIPTSWREQRILYGF